LTALAAVDETLIQGQKVVLAYLGWVILLGRGFRPYEPQQVSSTKVRRKQQSAVLGEVYNNMNEPQ